MNLHKRFCHWYYKDETWNREMGLEIDQLLIKNGRKQQEIIRLQMKLREYEA